MAPTTRPASESTIKSTVVVHSINSTCFSPSTWRSSDAAISQPVPSPCACRIRGTVCAPSRVFINAPAPARSSPAEASNLLPPPPSLPPPLPQQPPPPLRPLLHQHRRRLRMDQGVAGHNGVRQVQRHVLLAAHGHGNPRSEEHTSELQSLR